MNQEELKTIAEYVSTNIAYSNKEVLTAKEAAAYMGVTLSCLYRWTMERVVPHYKPNGKMCYFNRLELEQWLMSNRVETNDEINQKAQTYYTKGGIK